MKIQKVDYIDAVIEAIFQKQNDRLLLRAFLYRRVLNYTPKEAGKVLRLSIPHVNMLIQTIPHKRLNDLVFNGRYLIALEACQSFVIKKQTQSHLSHVKSVRDRLANHYRAI